IRRFVRSLVEERGTTVMLTTHDLGDIEDICRRIVIIDNGKIIHDGDLSALKDTYARDRVIHFQLARPPVDMGADLRRVAGLRSRRGWFASVGAVRPLRICRRGDRGGCDAARGGHRLPDRRARGGGPHP
ncbi:MAG TPA: hypothetical protein VF375_06770, partial [Candidatus Limnocylindrales bacterium]